MSSIIDANNTFYQLYLLNYTTQIHSIMYASLNSENSRQKMYVYGYNIMKSAVQMMMFVYELLMPL